MTTTYRLIADTPICEEYEYIFEEKNRNSPSTLYIQGPYMMAEEVNKNKRRYMLHEMEQEIERFTEEFIKPGRAIGELEHAESCSVNPERACHLITDLKQDGNIWHGRSKILSTPIGNIVRSLIQDGVKLGVSSRALGQLDELPDGTNKVTNFKLITVDVVADPSMPTAFVNGVLESKQYVLNTNGIYEEFYDKFESKLQNLPTKDKDLYLREAFVQFINSLTTK